MSEGEGEGVKRASTKKNERTRHVRGEAGVTPARRLLFPSFRLLIKYAQPSKLWNVWLTKWFNQNRTAFSYVTKSVSVNEFSYFLSSYFYRPLEPENDNIKQRKKGETQCFAKESSGHLLKLRFVLIENRWKKVLEEPQAICKRTSRDTSVFILTWPYRGLCRSKRLCSRIF